jgi:hypothetical protein
MGPIAYSLCQKKIIGFAMFAATLCIFPPLIEGIPISLATAGSVATSTFHVPVDKSYEFDLAFDFQSGKTYSEDQIAGTNYSKYCQGAVDYQEIPLESRIGLGRTIPIRVVVRNNLDRTVVFDQTFTTLCVFGTRAFIKMRKIGQVQLNRGDYIAEVKNIEAQTGLEGIRTYVSLVSGHGK